MLLISSNLFAQLEEKIKNQRVVPGSITRDGNKIEGYILRMGTEEIPFTMTGTKYSAPWTFQKEVVFMEKSKFESLPKIKYKDYEKLGPGDIQGYSYSNDSLEFESRKYANLNNPGLGMVPKMVFLRRVMKGSKVSVYLHYTAPSGNGPEASQIEEFNNAAKPYLVYFKTGDDNAKGLGVMNIEKQLGDCPKVVDRYKTGIYKKQGNEREKFGDWLIRASDQDISKLYAIGEYNYGICD